MGRRRFLGRVSGRDCSSYLPGLYTVSELDQMIFVDGYIPVANATEFTNINLGTSNRMGKGTCWDANYTTGSDKKYVQVLKLDFSDIGSQSGGIVALNAGIYDGNEILMVDVVFETTSNAAVNMALFGSVINNSILRNCRVLGVDITIHSELVPNSNASGLVAKVASGSSVINCSCTNVELSSVSRDVTFGGVFGLFVSGIIDDCCAQDTTISVMGPVGVLGLGDVGTFGGRINSSSGSTLSATVKNSESIGGMITTTGVSGAFICNNGDGSSGFWGGVVQDCSVTSIDIITTINLGGCFFGSTSGKVDRCKSESCSIAHTGTTGQADIAGFSGLYGYNASSKGYINECEVIDVEISSTGNRTAGFISTATTGAISNCRANGTVSGRANVVAFVSVSGGAATHTNCYAACTLAYSVSHYGYSVNSFTANDCYFDSTLAGTISSGSGVAKTTTELQTPTGSTGIYATWNPLIWDFGTSSDYPKLINTP